MEIETSHIINIVYFLKSKRQFMYFKKKFVANGFDTFPVNPGHCIISSICKSPNCYKFIRGEELFGSIVPSLMKNQKFSCHQCKGYITKDNLLVDISLQSILERTFTFQQLQQLDSVLITSNLEVIPQLKPRWEKINTQKNNIRLLKIEEFYQKLKVNPKMVISVNTRDIYTSLKKKAKEIEVQLHGLEAKNQNKSIQFCMLQRINQPRVIYCYDNKTTVYKMQDFKNIHLNQAKCCSLAFQKATKNLFYLNHNKQIYYSHIVKHTDKQTKLIKFIKVGKFVSEHYNKIIIDMKMHLYNNVLYIVGGQHYMKNIRDVLFCDMTPYITDRPQNHQIKFSVYTQMKEPKRLSGSDIFRYADKHYLLIYGGYTQIQSQYGKYKQENISNTIQYVQLKPKDSSDKKLQPIYEIKSPLPGIIVPTVVCFDSNFLIFGGFAKRKTNNLIYIVEMDMKNKTCKQRNQKLNEVIQLKLEQYGCGGSTENEIIILSKLAHNERALKIKFKKPEFAQMYETFPLG